MNDKATNVNERVIERKPNCLSWIRKGTFEIV
jgi:hypothetical protein